MNFLKKSWKFIVGVVGFLIGLVWFMNANSTKKIKRIRSDIKDNEKKTNKVKKKIKKVKKDKEVTKKKISKTNKKIQQVKTKKPVIKNKTGEEAVSSIKKRIRK